MIHLFLVGEVGDNWKKPRGYMEKGWNIIWRTKKNDNYYQKTIQNNIIWNLKKRQKNKNPLFKNFGKNYYKRYICSSVNLDFFTEKILKIYFFINMWRPDPSITH